METRSASAYTAAPGRPQSWWLGQHALAIACTIPPAKQASLTLPTLWSHQLWIQGGVHTQLAIVKAVDHIACRREQQ